MKVDPTRDPRIRKGLIPLIIALRVEAQRKEKLAAVTVAKAEAGETKPRRKKGWFG